MNDDIPIGLPVNGAPWVFPPGTLTLDAVRPIGEHTWAVEFTYQPLQRAENGKQECDRWPRS